MRWSFCVSMIGDSFLLRQRAVLHEAEQIAERLLFYKDRADFLIGGDGDFDHIAVSSVFYACARHPDARGRLMLFLPEGGGSIYERADLRGFFTRIVHVQSITGDRFAANFRAMVDRADFCVFCVTEPRGDAYAAMVYAREKEKPLCNLFGMLPEQKKPLTL